MLKVVIDTNVLISATITPKGNPAKILKAWKNGKLEVAISLEILKEIRQVIFRPRIKKLSFWTDKQRNQLVEDLINIGVLVPGSSKLKVVAEHRSDDKFIIAAIEGKAGYIITGDLHLKKLGSYKGIRIVTPAEFVRILQQQNS